MNAGDLQHALIRIPSETPIEVYDQDGRLLVITTHGYEADLAVHEYQIFITDQEFKT